MRKRVLSVAAILFVSVSVQFVTATVCDAAKNSFYQVALLQSLMLGEFDGSISVTELKKHGDFGLGTFDKVNGEMIVLDGHVYQALSDGTVREAQDDYTIPFASVAFFENAKNIELPAIGCAAELKSVLDAVISKNCANYFYLVKIPVRNARVSVRSVQKQKKPYRPLDRVINTDQAVFNYGSITGTVIGVYCPDYMSQLNAAGWHFHFLSEDKKSGGHLLEIALGKSTAMIAQVDSFEMDLPDSVSFKGLRLKTDLEKAIKQVETGE